MRILCLMVTLWAAGATQAQSGPAPVPNAPAPAADPVTIFNHPTDSRWYLAGQVNIIEQGHGGFRARYSGPNSLRSTAEHAASRIFTFYTAARLSNSTDAVFDLEEASGSGISNGLGLAGFTNLDVVRVPGEGSPLSTAPYVARAMVRQVVGLSRDTEEAEAGPLGVLTKLPVRRLEFRVGNFALPDFVDVNAIGSDSHLQFMNWTVVNNGAWDYAADTRGYTWGALVELHARTWALRFVEALMPQVANGIDLRWNLRRARGHNLELELHPRVLAKRTVVRLLAYRNIADMGSYGEAIERFRAGLTPAPDIVAARRPGSRKYGFGLNVEQQITSRLRGFGRVGWNDGHTESFVYTEVDRTGGFGGDYRGDRWGRRLDKVGAAFVANGLSAVHREYLALGGQGFLLGDGRLNYGRENIFEAYYTAHLWRGVFASLDLQHISNPGYNRDRGPVWVPALRLHFDL